jgi:hypothetical protein
MLKHLHSSKWSHHLQHLFPILMVGIATLAILAYSSTTAKAVPSFARQTGMACSACHVGGFGPQLTPYGRLFKMLGYSSGSTPKGYLPISGMALASFNSTKTGIPGGAAPHFGDNSNFAVNEISIFLAGRLAPGLGIFSQATYSGVDRASALDNTDLRYARQTQIGGNDLIIGVSLNNNPTIQDPWNSTTVWGFPFVASDLAPGPGAATIINDGLGTQVIGLTAYGFYNNMLYIEAGGYTTLAANVLRGLGIDADAGRADGLSPYWRIAFNKNIGDQAFSLGTFGMISKLLPDRVSGPNNKFRDVGLDATYQYLGGDHIVSVNSRYIHERQTLNADFAEDAAANLKNSLNSFNLNAAYYYKNTYGFTAGYFSTWGSRDTEVYAPAEIDGSRLGKPNSSGLIFQADWTPFGKDGSWGNSLANLRLGIQYTIYNKFNGAKKNYDGFGRNASDNDTLYMFAWSAF